MKFKQSLKNIRGMELAISTVVVLIVMLIIMVVVVSFFLGGTETVFNPIKDLANSTTGALSGEAGKLGLK